MITQLNNEIKISRQLDHPNIIKLYDTFDSGEDIYLVLELAANGQLFSKLCKEGKFDERNAKRMIREVMEAVAYLHSRNPPIIHRDIKPENILLDKNNHVKLAGTEGGI
jgi:serine/threonine protein kinase